MTNADSKKIMILGASILQVPAIKKAKEMGLYVIAVDMNPNAVGFQYADESLVISTVDELKVLEAAKHLNINGIITIASDMPMRTIARVVSAMHLVGIDIATALRTTNKAEMRRALNAYGVPVPKFYIATCFDEYMYAVKQFSSSFIVKPADNSGSRGVYQLSPSVDDAKLKETYAYSLSFSKSGLVLIEELMHGEEVSVETFSINGQCHIIQITDKLTTGTPHYVEMGHTQPTHFSEDMCNRIGEVAVRANHAVGIQNGPSHTEIMVTAQGPKVVEIGARLGGDCITTHLVPLSTGVDLVAACIKLSLGELPDIEPKFCRAAAIRYFKGNSGVIRDIQGVEDAFQTDGVKEIVFVRQKGDVVREICSSNDRIGFLIAQADARKDAIEICETAMKKIKIIIE